MNTFIVFLDDAEFSMRQIGPMRAGAGASSQQTQWVLVACPPRMTRHISKWVNHTARQKWRNKWADGLFNEVKDLLQSPQDLIVTELANGPMPEQTQGLLARYPAARVVDARRPKFGNDLDPLASDQRATGSSKLEASGFLTCLGLAMWLSAE